MLNLNKVELIGKIRKKPEVILQKDNEKINLVFNMDILVEDKSGTRQKITETYKIICLDRELSALLQKYAQDGSAIYIRGRLYTLVVKKENQEELFTTQVIVEEAKLMEEIYRTERCSQH
jgi:single-stranded DNA-binding protein